MSQIDTEYHPDQIFDRRLTKLSDLEMAKTLRRGRDPSSDLKV
jgi:hypothetical protein